MREHEELFRGTRPWRRNGWVLAAVLAIVGILLGSHQLARAADLAGQALGDATRLVLDAGWLLLLLGAAGLAAGLALSSPRGRATTRWLRRRLTARPVLVGTAAAGLLVVLVLVVVVVPPRFTANRQFKMASEELKAQSDVRTTLLQGFAALLVLTGAAIGAAVTLRQVRTTREGQITDRYTKAVDQLGSEHLDIRLGGIYALERIARDSPPDRATIEEVLTAYVRGHAPWPPPTPPPPPSSPSLQAITQRLVAFAQRHRSASQRRTATNTAGQAQQGQLDEQGAKPQRPTADVQAAITVLGRREFPPNGLRPLDLTGVDLRGAVLAGAKLQRARLGGANLQGAELSGANLQRAELDDANLQDAVLHDANLQDARLGRAKLQRAELTRVNFQGAWLNGADLQGAWLARADLQGAWLDGADLQDAVLNGADLQGAELRRAKLQGAELRRVNFQGAVLYDAKLQDATADKDTCWPAGWDRTKAEAHGVRYKDIAW